MIQVKEPIDVEGTRNQRRFVPQSFTWRGAKRNVEATTLPSIRTTPKGLQASYYVRDRDSHTYKLTHNLYSLTWFLDYCI